MSSGLLSGSEPIVDVPAMVKLCVSESPERMVSALRPPPPCQSPPAGSADAGAPAGTTAIRIGASAALVRTARERTEWLRIR